MSASLPSASLHRVLIANRGEIAARIARTCRRMGIEYVAVHSQADRGAGWLAGACAAVEIGLAPPSASYLNIARIIDAACDTNCDAIHPGYGFLSESAPFARAVEQAGLTFIGPSAETIEALGDKARAKVLMLEASVPTVPGSPEATEDLGRVGELAKDVGYPLLLKPSAGGGGKGMQVVREPGQLQEAAEQGMRIARANFGDARLLVERYIEHPRHVEVQVFGDHHGNVVHLFERECSMQRRHQKVIEEAPAVRLPDATRAMLLAAAVRGARSVKYANAGTFEFIVGPAGEAYFIEVNTRLQVEHPVTEAITGLDLVEWQLRIAAGEALPLSQEQIRANGHAIECRVYAEDPQNDFRPAPGRVTALRWPEGARVETGLEAGDEVSPYYDPMVAKLVLHAGSREVTLEAARGALARTAILGLTTNLGFLARVLADPEVRKGAVDTRFLDRHGPRFLSSPPRGLGAACAAALDLEACGHAPPPTSPWHAGSEGGAHDRRNLEPDAPWGRASYWDGISPVEAALAGRKARGVLAIIAESTAWHVTVRSEGDNLWSGEADGLAWFGKPGAAGFELQIGGERLSLEPYGGLAPTSAAAGDCATATMPGTVVAVTVAVGERVAAGTTLAIVEAMKMESRVVAGVEGSVTAVHCRVGDSVHAGDVLVSVEAD